MERFFAMVAGRPFEELRLAWLPVLGRSIPYPTMGEWVEAEDKLRNGDPVLYRQLQSDIGQLSEQYGLFPCQVLWTVFVKDFDPRDKDSPGWQFPLDSWQVRSALRFEGNAVRFIHQVNSLEAQPTAGKPQEPQDLSGLKLELELPLEFPPDLAVREGSVRMDRVRDRLRLSGLAVPKRFKARKVPEKIEAALATHAPTADFYKRLEGVCSENGLQCRVEVGQPSEAPIDEPAKTPLALVRLALLVPVSIRKRAMDRQIRSSLRLARECVSQAGPQLGQRIRISDLVPLAGKLRVDGGRLARRGMGDVVEDEFGMPELEEFERDPKREQLMNQSRSRRNQIKERLTRKGMIPPD